VSKAVLRSSYLQQRRALSDDLYFEISQKICTQFLFKFHSQLLAKKYLHVYLPIVKNKEVNTNLLIKTLRQRFKNLILVTSVSDFKTGLLKHIIFDQNTFLEENSYGIPEPVNGQIVANNELDMVIVPLLAFDSRGHRIGYGGGFYDRFLAETNQNCLKIGFSLFEPTDHVFDVEPTDIPLDYVVTPNHIYAFPTGPNIEQQLANKRVFL
jgi:5-formyltetrahydrofolate cyclo-ligase